MTPIKIGNLTIPNRFMRSAIWMNNCDNEGFPHKDLLDYYVSLAKGKVGLILPGYVYPLKSGKANVGQGGMWSDAHAESWRSTVEEIHKIGSKIIFQVADAGINTNFNNILERPRGATGLHPNTRTMTTMEIEEVIESFKNCAIRLQNIGADGIQIHAAHGYLISAFLSPLMNKRDDQYGGSLENRSRILHEIVNSIKSVTNSNFTISVKINGDDCKPGGFTSEESANVISKFNNVDLFEISGGLADARLTIRMKNKDMQLSNYPLIEGYNVESAKIIRKLSPNQKIAIVGGFRKFNEMEKIIENNVSDIISLGRPSLAETDFVQKFINGKKQTKCISCGLCILNASKGPVKCWI